MFEKVEKVESGVGGSVFVKSLFLINGWPFNQTQSHKKETRGYLKKLKRWVRMKEREEVGLRGKGSERKETEGNFD